MHRKQRGGLADNQTAAEHHNVFARERDAGAVEQLHDAGGRAGDETGVVLLREFAEIQRVETIDVFVRRDAAEDGEFVEVFRQRRLDEDAVDSGVGVELIDQGK